MRSRRSPSSRQALPPPGAAHHAVASPQHCPSVAAAQVVEGWNMVNHMSI